MENLIINRKQIKLEKNKEFTFKIPILIKSSESEFLIESSEETVLNQTYAIYFKLQNTKSGKEQFLIEVNEKVTTKVFDGINADAEYLLLACISDRNIRFSLSISRITRRFLQ